MKIALMVVHNYPVGGTTTWAQYVAQGLRANGVDLQVIKLKDQKTVIDPSEKIVRTLAEAKAAMVGCDFVIFQALADWIAFKRGKPMWVELAEDCPLPWAICTHDDKISTVGKNPYFDALMASPTFSRKIFAFSYMPTGVYPSDVKQIPLVLPFGGEIGWNKPHSERAAISFLSQIMGAKNWPLFARMAQRWDTGQTIYSGPVDFLLAGRAASSPGVSLTTQLRDHMIAAGATALDAEVERDRHKPTPWVVRLPNGCTFRYSGGYQPGDVMKATQWARVQCNMTSRRGGSVGPTEYVVLEAVAGGASPVQTDQNGKMDHYLHAPTFPYTLSGFSQMPKTLSGKYDAMVDDIINAAVQAYTETDYEVELRARNLREAHDPKVVTYWMVDAL